MANLNVSLLMRLIDQVSGPVRRMRTAVAVAMKGVEKAKLKADKSFERAANIRQAAEGVNSFARTARAAVMSPISAAEDFQAEMSRVKAISGLTGEAFNAVRQQALDLGGSTVFSANEVAQGMFFMAQGGFDAQQTMAAIPGVLDMAAASGIDLARASEIAVSVLGGFNLTADQSGRVADVLAKTSNISAVGLDDLAEAMSYAAPASASLGVSMESTAGMMAIMANAGIKGSRAGTALNAVLSRLAAPRGEGSDILEQLGIATIDKKTKQVRPLMEVLDEFQKKTAKYGKGAQAGAIGRIFGTEAMPAVMALMAQGSGAVNAATQQIVNSQGTAAAVAKEMMNNSKGATEELSGALDTLKVTMGDALLPELEALKRSLAEIVGGVTNWLKEHPRLTRVIMWSAVAVAGFATLLAGALFTASTIFAAKGLLTLVGGFKGVALAIGRFGIAPLLSWVAGMAKAALSAVIAAGPFLAVAAAIGAVSLAVVQLVKHWEKLDFLEGVSGIIDSVKETGFFSTVGELFDPRTLMQDMGIMDKPGTSPTAALAPPRPTIAGGASQQEVSGTIHLKVDSEGRPRVKQLESKGGVGLEVDAGLAMVAP